MTDVFSIRPGLDRMVGVTCSKYDLKKAVVLLGAKTIVY